MSCFFQTPDGDLDLTGGKLTLVQDQDTCLAFKLTNRFKLFLGEWFLDSRIGIPYFQVVLVKNPDMTAIGQLFKGVILQTPGVSDLLEASLDFYSSLRNMVANFRIRSQTGAILVGGPGLPFIVEFNAKGQS